jgi:curli biogenesis system outer membrane secretion channel CsgG
MPAGTPRAPPLDPRRGALYHARTMLCLRLSVLVCALAVAGCQTPRRAVDGTLLYRYRLGQEVPPVVAVMDFENRASWAGQWNLSGGMADLLVARLMETRKVVVLERQHLKDVLEELDRQGGDHFRPEGRAQLGRLKNAQFLMRGTINDFTVIEEGSAGFWSSFLRIFGRGNRARVALTVKVYDIENGEVLAAVQSDGTVSSGGGGAAITYKQVTFGGDSFFRTPLGQATERALDRAVKRILDALPIDYWAPRVAEVADLRAGPLVVINGGVNAGVNVGDEFVVRDLPRIVTDPVTGNIIEQPAGEVVGRVRVTEVLPKSAHAKLLQGLAARGQVLAKVVVQP